MIETEKVVRRPSRTIATAAESKLSGNGVPVAMVGQAKADVTRARSMVRSDSVPTT